MVADNILNSLAFEQNLQASKFGKPKLTMYHSHIKPGDWYVSASGKYFDEAIAAGAKLIWSDSDKSAIDKYKQTPVAYRANLAKDLPKLMADFFQLTNPAANYIGITGTNGKTSCCQWLYQSLQNANKTAGYIGTLGLQSTAQPTIINTGYTTPDIVAMQQYLQLFERQNIDNIIIEATSHGLAQNRIANVAFNIAVFTNLSRDHLDYHQTMQHYFSCKTQLFLDYPITSAIVNIDDAWGKKLATLVRQKQATCNILTYSLKDNSASVFVANIGEQSLTIKFAKQSLNLYIPNLLLTDFNIQNLLVVFCCLKQLGLSITAIADTMQHLQAPAGRLQILRSNNKQIIIDFAHTPDSLEKTLQAIKKITKNKLWVVVGCGGDRDKGKRPIMANIACTTADNCIFTSDNPRGEAAQAIIDDMTANLNYNNYKTQVDRKAAINYALQNSQPEDNIVIAGRGHESHQLIGDKLLPFNDYEVTQELLAISNVAN